MKNREISPKAKIIIKIWLLGFAFVIFLSGSATFALDPMGPPAADMEYGQFKIGADYSCSNMDLELNKGIYVTYLDGWYDSSGPERSYTLKDFEVRKFYTNLGYGLAENWDSFLRLGGTNAKFGDSAFSPELWPGGEEFSSRTDFSIGFGIKGTFCQEGDLKIGGLFQLNWSEFDGAIKPAGWPVADDCVEMELTEIQVAVGPAYRLTESILIYGGPFLHFIDGDWSDVYSEMTEEEPYQLKTSKYSWKIEETSIFGGYFGAQMELAENCSLNIEFQHTATSDAVGASIAWRF